MHTSFNRINVCTPDPKALCVPGGNPVCGKDDRTYANECLAKAACQFDGSTQGECAVSNRINVCTPDPKALCDPGGNPVCGKDDRTYANECLAKAACQFDGSTQGECAVSNRINDEKGFLQICGRDGVTTYDNACEAKRACQFDFSTPGECCTPNAQLACDEEPDDQPPPPPTAPTVCGNPEPGKCVETPGPKDPNEQHGVRLQRILPIARLRAC